MRSEISGRCLGIVTIVLLTVAPALGAGLTLPAVFTDRLVLQREMPVPVWGSAGAGDAVTVEFAGQSKNATADDKGYWAVRLDAMPASALPRELVVRTNAGESRKLGDVLVGEVWLCSGQSNMFRPLGRIAEQATRFPGVSNSEEAINSPEQPELRLYCDDEHELWKAAGWQHATPTSRRPFSAVAYFFGTALQRELKVPVGLIHVSRGGTPVQSWTPKEFAMRVPIVTHYNGLLQDNRQAVTDFGKARLSAKEAKKKKPDPLADDVDTSRLFGTFHLYDNLIEPVAPYGIRGVLWYQGESNAKHLDVAQHYDELLRALIDGWRARWKQERLPVYFVQLPCWERGDNWPWVRQGMLNVSRTAPDVGMAVTVDFGDRKQLHPPEKTEVGERLAKIALAKSYGKQVICTGPIVRSITREGNTLKLGFDTGGTSLQLKGATWNDVEVAGADGVFHPAAATIGESSAVVKAAAAPTPLSVRYGWKATFEPTLFNEAKLPASPFAYTLDDSGKVHPPEPPTFRTPGVNAAMELSPPR